MTTQYINTQLVQLLKDDHQLHEACNWLDVSVDTANQLLNREQKGKRLLKSQHEQATFAMKLR